MAQAIAYPTSSTFIAQLLAPLADSRQRRLLAAEMRREAEEAWALVYHRYYAAEAYCSYTSHRASAAELVTRRLDGPERAAHALSHLAYIQAVDQLMRVPAPRIGALRLKQKLRRLDGGRDRWEAAITADEARLERKI